MTRGGRYGLAAALLLIFGVTLGLVVPVRFEQDPVFWDALLNATHFPIFLSVTWALWWGVAPRRLGAARSIGFAVLAAALMAATLEAIQPLVHRTASLGDLIIGMLGIAVASIGISWWPRGRRWRAALASVCLLTLVVVLLPAGLEWQAIVWRTAQFPSLGDFEQRIELRLWDALGGTPSAPTVVSRSDAIASSGRYSLHIRPGGGSWPGVAYRAGPDDWRPYSVLAVDIHNPGPPFGLWLRVDDRGSVDYATRFNMKHTIEPGWNAIRLPLELIADAPTAGRLDLSHVRAFVLFAEAKAAPDEFSLDGVRLLP